MFRCSDSERKFDVKLNDKFSTQCRRNIASVFVKLRFGGKINFT